MVNPRDISEAVAFNFKKVVKSHATFESFSTRFGQNVSHLAFIYFQERTAQITYPFSNPFTAESEKDGATCRTTFTWVVRWEVAGRELQLLKLYSVERAFFCYMRCLWNAAKLHLKALEYKVFQLEFVFIRVAFLLKGIHSFNTLGEEIARINFHVITGATGACQYPGADFSKLLHHMNSTISLLLFISFGIREA